MTRIYGVLLLTASQREDDEERKKIRYRKILFFTIEPEAVALAASEFCQSCGFF